jgi:hypothetical protein
VPALAPPAIVEMAVAVGKRVLDTGWLAARSTEVALTGVQLTTTHPPAADPAPPAPWMSAAVPGTYVLSPPFSPDAPAGNSGALGICD